MTDFGPQDLRRLEDKVDKLAEAIQRLIVIEERQSTQGERIGKAEAALAVHDTRIQHIDRKMEMWVNRGIGVWGLAVTVFAIIQFASKFVK